MSPCINPIFFRQSCKAVSFRNSREKTGNVSVLLPAEILSVGECRSRNTGIQPRESRSRAKACARDERRLERRQTAGSESSVSSRSGSAKLMIWGRKIGIPDLDVSSGIKFFFFLFVERRILLRD